MVIKTFFYRDDLTMFGREDPSIFFVYSGTVWLANPKQAWRVVRRLLQAHAVIMHGAIV
jgi:hypothetical protein